MIDSGSTAARKFSSISGMGLRSNIFTDHCLGLLEKLVKNYLTSIRSIKLCIQTWFVLLTSAFGFNG